MSSPLLRRLYDISRRIIEENKLMYERVEVHVRPLKAEEAIGKPSISDYALLKGKEVMIEAMFKGYKGQAFTSTPRSFSGLLREVFNLNMFNPWNRSIFIAVLNAVMAYLGLVDKTVHCKDDYPLICGHELSLYLKGYNVSRVGLIGYQPAMLKSLSEFGFNVRVADANPDNIGKVKFGIEIESPDADEDIISWSEVALVTGSALVNGSLDNVIVKYKNKVILYGVSCAAPAKILGFKRWCISRERVVQ